LVETGLPYGICDDVIGCGAGCRIGFVMTSSAVVLVVVVICDDVIGCGAGCCGGDCVVVVVV